MLSLLCFCQRNVCCYSLCCMSSAVTACTYRGKKVQTNSVLILEQTNYASSPPFFVLFRLPLPRLRRPVLWWKTTLRIWNPFVFRASLGSSFSSPQTGSPPVVALMESINERAFRGFVVVSHILSAYQNLPSSKLAVVSRSPFSVSALLGFHSEPSYFNTWVQVATTVPFLSQSKVPSAIRPLQMQNKRCQRWSQKDLIKVQVAIKTYQAWTKAV